MTSLSSEDIDACLQCLLDAQVMIPSSVHAALVSAPISLSLLSAAAIHHPSIQRGDQGMAHVTFSDVVTKGQVDVDGGYIAEHQRGHTHGIDAHHCFQLVLFSAVRGW